MAFLLSIVYGVTSFSQLSKYLMNYLNLSIKPVNGNFVINSQCSDRNDKGTDIYQLASYNEALEVASQIAVNHNNDTVNRIARVLV